MCMFNQISDVFYALFLCKLLMLYLNCHFLLFLIDENYFVNKMEKIELLDILFNDFYLNF